MTGSKTLGPPANGAAVAGRGSVRRAIFKDLRAKRRRSDVSNTAVRRPPAPAQRRLRETPLISLKSIVILPGGFLARTKRILASPERGRITSPFAGKHG
jgi:hypothetical protein